MLKRTGGIAGICGEWVVDAAELPMKKNQEFQALLKEADFFCLSQEIKPELAARDEFHYELTVEAANQKHTVRCSDSAAPKTLQRCWTWIVQFGAQCRREA